MTDVAFLIGNLDKERGGAQRLLYDCCVRLPDEFDCTVYYLFGAGTYRADFEATRTRVVDLDATGNADVRTFVRFLHHLRADSPDLLQTNSPISGLWGRIAARFAGVPHLVSVEHHLHDTRRPFVRALDDLTLPLADTVVGVSEAVAASFAPCERTVLDAADTPVVTIPNGVDVDGFDTIHGTDPLDSVPIEPGDPVVGTVGRHIAGKGYSCLIDAMARVVDDRPTAKLVLVGDGPERAALERRAERRGLLDPDDPAAVFVGAQPSVGPFLARFDVGAFPSLDESFGLALAEAMAAGVPVVATDIPPFRRLLDGGGAGVLVPTRDPDALAGAIESLLADGDRRERLGTAGRDRIEREFSVAHTAREYAALYRRLVTG